MTLTSILVFIAGAALFRFLPIRWRGPALFLGSILAIYWLQPAIAVQPMDFILPTLTLILAVVGWYVTRPAGTDTTPDTLTRDDQIALGATAAIPLALALLGELPGLPRLTPSPPPALFDALLALGTVALGAVVLRPMFAVPGTARQAAIPALLVLIIGLFVILKAEPLAVDLAGWLRARAGRTLTLAGVVDVGWLGFSYVAFRLIHTLRDRQVGKLPPLGLREYLTYIIFFPAFTAGPIDRAERFVKDYRALDATAHVLPPSRAVEGAGRIVIGILKKFVVADSLALFALNTINADQTGSALGTWLLLYGFAFRLYFDFSGYSDIAIGIGRLYGINLPENFNLPYLRSNITAFWQSWHMTLSGWARFYIFMPLSRWLMTRPQKPSTEVVILVAQVSTMLVIGLWHGITLNFILWGVWHGVGLWIHKLYSDRTREFYIGLKERPRRALAVQLAGILLTFHFVAIGWVFFALPDTDLSLRVIGRLFGLGA